MHDLSHFIDRVREILVTHELGSPGAYRRWITQDANGGRDLGINEYGVADAANILYTIGWFPESPDERAGWVAQIRDLQEPASGMFREATHHPIHTTAHCLAALELFDARPLHPLTELRSYREIAAMEAFLDGLDWVNKPWPQSHQGAGLYASLVIAREVPTAWRKAYFAWIDAHTDAATGLLRAGCVDATDASTIFPHLAGTFHYLFNIQHERHPLAAPEALVDTCLRFTTDHSYPLGERVGFAEIDWVYCLNRAVRQCGHRFTEARDALRGFADRYISFLTGLDPTTHERLNDLHLLFGALCCLAELQNALPGHIQTDRPLKLVLDRRPFI